MEKLTLEVRTKTNPKTLNPQVLSKSPATHPL